MTPWRSSATRPTTCPASPGIGLKTAAALIKEYGSLGRAAGRRAGEIKQPKRRETLLASIDQAKLSRRLVALEENVPLPIALDDLRLPAPDPEKLVGFLKAMEFQHPDPPHRLDAACGPREGEARSGPAAWVGRSRRAPRSR